MLAVLSRAASDVVDEDDEIADEGLAGHVGVREVLGKPVILFGTDETQDLDRPPVHAEIVEHEHRLFLVQFVLDKGKDLQRSDVVLVRPFSIQ